MRLGRQACWAHPKLLHQSLPLNNCPCSESQTVNKWAWLRARELYRQNTGFGPRAVACHPSPLPQARPEPPKPALHASPLRTVHRGRCQPSGPGAWSSACPGRARATGALVPGPRPRPGPLPRPPLTPVHGENPTASHDAAARDGGLVGNVPPKPRHSPAENPTGPAVGQGHRPKCPGEPASGAPSTGRATETARAVLRPRTGGRVGKRGEGGRGHPTIRRPRGRLHAPHLPGHRLLPATLPWPLLDERHYKDTERLSNLPHVTQHFPARASGQVPGLSLGLGGHGLLLTPVSATLRPPLVHFLHKHTLGSENSAPSSTPARSQRPS